MSETPSVAKKIDKVIFKIMWGVSVLSGISLFAVAILCTVDALGGKLFSVSIPNGTEIVTYLNIPVVFFAMAFIQVERGHTTVDLFSGRFPKPVQTVIHLIGYVLGAVICGYVGYCSFQLVLDKFATHAKASASATSFVVWPFALVIVAGFALISFAFLWCVFREFLIPPSERMGALPVPEHGDGTSDAAHMMGDAEGTSDVSHMMRDIENLKDSNGGKEG